MTARRGRALTVLGAAVALLLLAWATVQRGGDSDPQAEMESTHRGEPSLLGVEARKRHIVVHVRTLDRLGSPVRATVSATEVASEASVEVIPTKPGEWELRLPEATDLVVRASAEGYEDGVARWRASDGETLTIELASRCVLRVKVTTLRGAAVKSARCYVTLASRPERVLSGRTDARGLTVIDVSELPRGVLRLEVKHPSFLKRALTVPEVRGVRAVSVELAQGVALQLKGPEDSSWLTGQAVDVNAWNLTFSDRFSLNGSALAGGSVVGVGLVPEGTVAFRVRVCGTLIHDQEAEVAAPDHTIHLAESLARFRPVALRVTDDDDGPISDARCVVVSEGRAIGRGYPDDNGRLLVLVPKAVGARIRAEARGFHSRDVDVARLAPNDVHAIRMVRIERVSFRVELDAGAEYDLSLIPRGTAAAEVRVSGTAGETRHAVTAGAYDYDLRVHTGKRFRGVFVATATSKALRPSTADAMVRVGIQASEGPYPIHGVIGANALRGVPFTLTSAKEIWVEVEAVELAVHVFTSAGPVAVGSVSPAKTRLQIQPGDALGNTKITLRALGEGIRSVQYGTREGLSRSSEMPRSGVLELVERLTEPVTWRVEVPGFEAEKRLVPGAAQQIDVGYARGGLLTLEASTVVTVYSAAEQTNHVVLAREASDQWRLPQTPSRLLVLGMRGARRTFGTIRSASARPELTSLGHARLVDAAGRPITGRVEWLVEHDADVRMSVLYAEVRDGALEELDLKYFGNPRCLIRVQTDMGKGSTTVQLHSQRAPDEIRVPMNTRERR